MRSAAPPVRYFSPTGDTGWRTLQRALAALAAAVLAAWLAQRLAASPAVLVPAALAAGGLAAWAFGFWLGPAGADLVWDGACWRCDGVVGGVSLHIDLGGHLLVRFVPDAAPRRVRWLALSRRAAPACWHGLRVALIDAPATATPAAPAADAR